METAFSGATILLEMQHMHFEDITLDVHCNAHLNDLGTGNAEIERRIDRVGRHEAVHGAAAGFVGKGEEFAPQVIGQLPRVDTQPLVVAPGQIKGGRWAAA